MIVHDDISWRLFMMIFPGNGYDDISWKTGHKRGKKL